MRTVLTTSAMRGWDYKPVNINAALSGDIWLKLPDGNNIIYRLKQSALEQYKE